MQEPVRFEDFFEQNRSKVFGAMCFGRREVLLSPAASAGVSIEMRVEPRREPIEPRLDRVEPRIDPAETGVRPGGERVRPRGERV